MKTFWRILKLLGDHKWLTIVGFALAFAQMGLGLIVPRIIQLTINNALVGGQTGLLVTYGLALLGVALIRLVVGVGRRLATGKVSLDIEYDLRNRMWARVLSQSFSYFDRWPTGQLMSRAMSDIQNVRMFLGYGLVFFATNIVMMVAISVILFFLDWKLALMSLAFMPFLLLVTIRFSMRLKPILMDVQQKIADVTAAAEECASSRARTTSSSSSATAVTRSSRRASPPPGREPSTSRSSPSSPTSPSPSSCTTAAAR
jgi:ABC-type multidrug transport system fused ATPase/permease subunit